MNEGESDKNCNHAWVYSDEIYCTYPAQQDRICKTCGKKECVTLGIYEDPNEYSKLVEKFKKR